MAKYRVEIPCFGVNVFEIEAGTPEEAIERVSNGDFEDSDTQGILDVEQDKDTNNWNYIVLE